MFLFHISIY